MFPGMNAIVEKDSWEGRTSNAVAVRENFARACVVNQHLACRTSFFEKDANHL